MQKSLPLALLVGVPALVASAPAQAQLSPRGTFNGLNYSGLQGKSLTGVVTPTGIGGLLGVASPTIMRGSCRISAKIIEDRPGGLVVELSYINMPTNVRRLNLTVVDAVGTKAVAGAERGVVNLSPGESEATVTVSLPVSPGAAEGTFESKRLFVWGAGSQPHIVAVNQMFECAKKWLKSPSVLVAEPLSALPQQPPEAGAAVATAFNPALIKLIKMSELKAVNPAVLRPTKSVLLRPQFLRGGKPVAARNTPVLKATASPMMLTKANKAILMAGPAQGAPMTITKAKFAHLKLIDPSIFAKPAPAVQSDQGEGPAGANIIGFADRIEANPQWVEVPRALSITPALYGDKNRNSGLFYYLPARYVLDFDATNGFALQMFYGSSGEVTISAVLRASVNAADLSVAELFLQLFCRSQNIPYKRIVPFFGTPQATLESALAAQLFLPPDKVRVVGVGDGVVNVNFVASPDKVELFLARLLSNVGLAGEMSYTSTADPTLKVGVPMELRLPDRASLRMNLSPQNAFVNDSPFPITLKYLNLLRFTGTVPTVYTFDLPDNELAPRTSVTIDKSKIPVWMTQGASKLWVDFEVIPDAGSMERALQAATTASSGAPTVAVTAERVSDFPAGVTAVTVVVTSRYFTPFGAKEETKEVTLGPTDTSIAVGTVYPRGRQEGIDMGADNPYLKWQLKVTKAGRVLKTPVMTSNRLTLGIGTEQIGQAK
jgi:hypothetical protein